MQPVSSDPHAAQAPLTVQAPGADTAAAILAERFALPESSGIEVALSSMQCFLIELDSTTDVCGCRDLHLFSALPPDTTSMVTHPKMCMCRSCHWLVLEGVLRHHIIAVGALRSWHPCWCPYQIEQFQAVSKPCSLLHLPHRSVCHYACTETTRLSALSGFSSVPKALPKHRARLTHRRRTNKHER